MFGLKYSASYVVFWLKYSEISHSQVHSSCFIINSSLLWPINFGEHCASSVDGLYLAGDKFKQSNKPILNNSGKLCIELYTDEPLVYVACEDASNSPHSNQMSNWKELQDANPDFSLIKEYSVDYIPKTDVCILFPIAKAFYASHSINENPMEKVIIDEFPVIETTDDFIQSPKDLATWMKSIYEDNVVEIISYEEVNPIFTIIDRRNINGFTKRLVPGITHKHKELTFKIWLSDTPSINLVPWIDKFHFCNGVLVNQFGITNSKKCVIDFIKVPIITKHDSLHLQTIHPNTNTEETLLRNNIIYESNSMPFAAQKISQKLKDSANHIPLEISFKPLSQHDIDEAFKQMNMKFEYLTESKGNIRKQSQVYDWLTEYKNDDSLLEILLTGFTIVNVDKIDFTEIHIRVNFGEHLNDDCFQVFGHVVDDDNKKLEDVIIKFDLFDYDGFSAFIILNQETAMNVEKLHVAWIIVGKPEIIDVVYISLPCIMSENDVILLVASYDPPLNNPPAKNIKILKWAGRDLCLKITGNFDEEILDLTQLSLYYHEDLLRRRDDIKTVTLEESDTRDYWSIHSATIDIMDTSDRLVESQTFNNIFQTMLKVETRELNVEIVITEIIQMAIKQYNTVCKGYEKWESIKCYEADELWKHVDPNNIRSEIDFMTLNWTQALPNKQLELLISSVTYLTNISLIQENLNNLSIVIENLKIPHSPNLWVITFSKSLNDKNSTLGDLQTIFGDINKQFKRLKLSEEFWSTIKEMACSNECINFLQELVGHDLKNLINCADDYSDECLIQEDAISTFIQVKQILEPLLSKKNETTFQLAVDTFVKSL
ncbi:17210_t:CDS:2, partial [Gigaspora margarita]